MRHVKTLALLGLAFAVGACQDLQVDNVNAPDESRALSEPGDVESLIGSGFRNWFYGFSRTYPAFALAVAADENTGSWGNWGMQHISSEPRAAFPNETGYSYRGVAQGPWFDLYEVISAMNDGLRAINEGLEIGEGGADAPRAQAFAKFMQGLAHGYIALHFDRGFIFTEEMDLESTEFELVDYNAMMAQAYESLGEAISIANSNSFTLPDNTWMEGVSGFTSDDLVRLANSYYARFLASVARTPADRDAVNWQEVINRADAGITEDFGVTLVDWFDSLKYYSQRYDWIRADYKTLGPSDISGAYQDWLATPVADRRDFDMNSPDLRVQGPGGVGENGTYFTYRFTQNHREDRGTYHFSRYHWTRLFYIRETGDGWDPIFPIAELDLLRAEAHIRLGQPAMAVDLINRTRVDRGGLPPATVDGVQGQADCVPKMILDTNGACADLWNTLMYEKRIENFDIAAGVAFWDARGWGILPSGTPLHLPIPARELETLQIPIYTFGGGGEGSAQ
jgi:hypothetical protein